MFDDLIRRLEAATEGSAALDGLVFAHLNGRRADEINPLCAGPEDHCIAIDGRWRKAPRYSRSLDAALTLVPEGAGVTLHSYWVASRKEAVWSAKLIWGFGGNSAESEDAPTPALALCAAALKARASQAGAPEAEDTP